AGRVMLRHWVVLLSRAPTLCPGEHSGENEARAAPPTFAARTRIVSAAGIRLDHRKSVRSFKGIICHDISEFESYMPSNPVGSLGGMSRPHEFARHSRGLRRRWRGSVADFS